MKKGDPVDKHPWWQTAVFYELYPQSFMDSNGDGFGDLPGIISKLDYLGWLGINAIWLCPIYASPMMDFGYDVSDYTDIHPAFGTMKDFDAFVDEVHRRSIRVVMDFIPNHTSDLHPWFQEARSSRENSKRDWYIWRDPEPDGSPPNNWLSIFGGNAWTWDEGTSQYYYHTFHRGEPELNWRNPEVEAAMLDVMRFWLDRGTDGIRADAIWYLIKDQHLRDNPLNPGYAKGSPRHEQLNPFYSADQPEVHGILRRMRKVIDEYDDRVLIGELYLSLKETLAYYGCDNDQLHLPFNFSLVTLPWDARQIANLISQYEGALASEAWPNWVLGNHDIPRVATRLGNVPARIAAMLLLTLRGTPFLYYGDEIGMEDVPLPPDEPPDPQAEDLPIKKNRASRRTPMQWSDAPGAGFTTGTPWVSLSKQYEKANVKAQQNDPSSLLALHKQLITLRKQEPALCTGDYFPVATDNDILAFRRIAGDAQFLVAINLGEKKAVLQASTFPLRGRIEVSTTIERNGTDIESEVPLNANEGVVVRLS